jgi:hypothetical protein
MLFCLVTIAMSNNLMVIDMLLIKEWSPFEYAGTTVALGTLFTRGRPIGCPIA